MFFPSAVHHGVILEKPGQVDPNYYPWYHLELRFKACGLNKKELSKIKYHSGPKKVDSIYISTKVHIANQMIRFR